MRGHWRWAVMVVASAVLVCLPLAARLLPAGSSTLPAAALLARITASGSVAYSGYAESQGGLSLPVGQAQLGALNELFGGQSRLRVWWRGSDDWRVDTIGFTGETDLHHDATGTWTWDYEAETVRHDPAGTRPSVRIPRPDDVVPASLARRLLGEASPSDVTRLPGRRVAGEQTAGLRLRVHDRRSTVEHIDVWALPSSGLAVRVEAYGRGSTRPVLSTSFLDLELGAPSPAVTAFHPAAGQRTFESEFPDVASFVDRFGRSNPPARLVGLARRTDLDLGAIGVYGRGVTVLVAVPLDSHLAGEIVGPARSVPGSVEDATGIGLSAGPLNLQLSPPVGFGSRWLLVGTLTPSALRAAVAALPSPEVFGERFRRGGR